MKASISPQDDLFQPFVLNIVIESKEEAMQLLRQLSTNYRAGDKVHAEDVLRKAMERRGYTP